MKPPRLFPVLLAVLAAGLAGCSTTRSPERLPANSPMDNLGRLQNQIYEAATGPHHVGSVYTR